MDKIIFLSFYLYFVCLHPHQRINQIFVCFLYSHWRIRIKPPRCNSFKVGSLGGIGSNLLWVQKTSQRFMAYFKESSEGLTLTSIYNWQDSCPNSQFTSLQIFHTFFFFFCCFYFFSFWKNLGLFKKKKPTPPFASYFWEFFIVILLHFGSIKEMEL